MGLIITPDFIGKISSGGENKFSVSMKGKNGIDLVFNGKPEIIIQMIFDSMSAGYEHVTKTMITAVLIFADQKGIPHDELKKHSYLQDNKIVTP